MKANCRISTGIDYNFMKSRYADYFNHDEDASSYDSDVKNEIHPIRTGYDSALKWIGQSVKHCNNILDLGTGTGNTILVLPETAHIASVDISKKMIEIAKRKLVDRSVDYIISDLLEYIDNAPADHFDGIVSSYAIHHLTDDEKEYIFKKMYKLIHDQGIIVVVDLMYENDEELKNIIMKYTNTHSDVIEGINDEFFWNIEKTMKEFRNIGYTTVTKQFSNLSWGLLLKKNKRGI